MINAKSIYIGLGWLKTQIKARKAAVRKMNTTIILFIIIISQSIMHYIERRDLYNRIMSQDLIDYNQRNNSPKKVGNFIKKNMGNMFGGGNDEE